MLQRVFRSREVRENYHRGSKSKFYADIKAGEFPKADVRLSERIPGWTEGILEQHQAKQMAAAAQEQSDTA